MSIDRATPAEATQATSSNDSVGDPPASRGIAFRRIELFLYLLPAVLVFTLFLVAPVAGTVVISTTD